MFVMRHCGRDVWRELECHVAKVRVTRPLAEHDRRLALSFQDHVVGNVTGRCGTTKHTRSSTGFSLQSRHHGVRNSRMNIVFGRSETIDAYVSIRFSF